ncbi:MULTISPECIES: WG repeat-containing protein [unclassified Sphingobacterium]|uniref:WG repeat-containing protein n=1 Tax=unclassified Sphingobacterium TaxID=2609468 RepID=UPI001047C52B|nr:MULTISPECIES: WG repeat-containing protein [unclassified Sphingobacterium]MCS3554511.1 hypothetical protein [Sphingobacterium sp. JUb21]TCR07502.1 WG repeat protein [Sphingobacterium sp. JUb20]
MNYLLLFFFTILSACTNNTIQKQDMRKSKIVQLPGHYNVQDNTWENSDPNYDAYSSFGEDLYATFSKLDKDGNSLGLGLIDKSGKVIIQPIYSSVTMRIRTENDFFVVSDSLNNYGIVNSEGVEIVNPQFDDIYFGNNAADSMDTKFGLIKVSKNDKKGYINATGRVIVPVKYDDLFMMGKNGLIMFQVLIPIGNGNNTAKWGIMDFDQKIISPPRFSYPSRFENGRVTLVSEGIEYDVNENGIIKKK